MKTYPIKLSSFIKGILALFVAMLSICQPGLTQGGARTVVVPLKNNKYLSIQACTDRIFRIRLSATSDFPESLMERYGIVKTDWSPVKVTSKKEKRNRIVQTSGFKLTVNEATSDICVNDSTEKVVIGNLHLYHEGIQPVCKKLAESLQQYFGDEKQASGIIGDKSTGSSPDSIKVRNSSVSSVLEIQLSPNERFYAGGATSRKNIQHRGEALRMWATYQKTEIPMPFIMSSEGWGVFNNTTSLNYFDIGRFQNDKLFISNTDGTLDFYVMLGNSMGGAINLFTTITGKPFLLPKWAYGLAFGGNTMENQLDVMTDAVRFRDEKIPCDIYWLEPQWMAKNYDFSTSKNWNLDKFPAEPFWEVKKFPKQETPNLFIDKLHKLGFKLALWLCVDYDLSIEEEDRLAAKTGNFQSGQEHWFPHLTKFMDEGVDGFKLDPGRTLDEHPDRKYYNGHTDKEMHNLNQVLLPKQMYTTFREHKGIRSFHHYCGGYAGTQHWGASTSGDNGGGKDALFDQLNLGLSGFMNTSCDVMEGKDGNKAGMHLGFFLPWVQVNSWFELLHPYYMRPDERETFRYYSQLRNSLFPYIYSAALQGSQTGMPIVRAMPLVFPDDRKVDNMVYQYMFGENLLAGVFSDSIYLPKGNWINYWSGEKLAGGNTIQSKVPANRGGLLFIKAGAIIPYQKPMQYISEFPNDTLIIRVYPEKQSSYTLLEDDGKTFGYEKGEVSSTKFTCDAGASQLEFTINATQGTYQGMPLDRVYELEIGWPENPRKITINEKAITDWKYGKDQNIRLFVKSKLAETQKILISK